MLVSHGCVGKCKIWRLIEHIPTCAPYRCVYGVLKCWELCVVMAALAVTVVYACICLKVSISAEGVHTLFECGC